MSRKTVAQIVKELNKRFPGIAGIKDAGEWSPDKKGAIHLGNAGEDGDINGMYAADYYADNSLYTLGVHNSLVAALDEFGYFAEWYDSGTLLAYKI